jgi:hypothetical protein
MVVIVPLAALFQSTPFLIERANFFVGFNPIGSASVSIHALPHRKGEQPAILVLWL